MKAFKQYLQKAGYAATTVAQHVVNLQHYLDWKSQNRNNNEKEDTRLIHGYINELQQRKNHSATINLQLRSIELYYQSLNRNPNPAEGVRVQSSGGSFTKSFPGVEQLEEIYTSYTKREYRNESAQLRNTVLLGLIIYQGLSSTDIHRLERQHVKLAEGKIEIPPSKRTNGRILKLEALQIVLLQKYLQQLSEHKTTLLFTDLDNIQTYLLKQVQAIAPEIPHIRLLRQSRIVYWLKVCHAREVQYRAGFKHISTVENYQRQDLETLKEELEKHHPLR
jgi:integrase/recombinase XerD